MNCFSTCHSSFASGIPGAPWATRWRRRLRAALVLVVPMAGGATNPLPAQAASIPGTVAALKKLTLEDLAGLEISSVSRRTELLTEAASAVQVVTGEDIRRSGAAVLPEALRLAGNLAVAQLDSAQWAVSARGFNSPLANKLLVLIDGRTVYSPLFAGVFWETQDVLLEDVDRIEVISGPGATLWGSNAVNGIINVVTRPAKATPGWFVEVGAGTETRGSGAVRYGGSVGRNGHFRIYGKYAAHDGTVAPGGQDLPNDWDHAQGGARFDWGLSDAETLTIQGDIHETSQSSGGAIDAVARGANLLGRWSRRFSTASDVQVQIYFDRVHRNVPATYNDVLETWDLDFQHRLPIAAGHDLIWGAGLRVVEDDFRPGSLVLVPRRVSLETYSAFVQDEIAVVPDRMHVTLGAKVEHNDYTGLEVQPGVRAAWRPVGPQTLWAAVSRAVRAPSRLDRDLIMPPLTAGGPDFDSEDLVAWELGWRVQPTEHLSFALAGYYHDYDGIRSVEPGNPPAPFPLVFDNGQEGETYGVEVTADVQVTGNWRLHAGWSELRVDIRPQPGSADQSFGRAEAADSKHRLLLRSSVDLWAAWEFDAIVRCVSRITNPNIAVPGYTELDLRLAWRPRPELELSLTGRNLLEDQHAEFGDAATRQAIERSVQGRVTWRY